MKTIFTFLITAIFAINISHAQTVGQIASDFTLKNLAGQDYQLSQNKGKVVAIFFVGYNCSLCLASAPSVKSKVFDPFIDNIDFQALVIDVYDGSTAAVQGFKNSTNISATFLQKGSSVASDWTSTKDRIIVIDSEGKMVFKGTRAAQSDADAAVTAIDNALKNVTTSVDLIGDGIGFNLGQNYPNPAVDKTTIEFSVGSASQVRLSVYDITGKTVSIPVDQFFYEGKYEVSLLNLKKGIYFYKLEADNYVLSKKMVFQ